MRTVVVTGANRGMGLGYVEHYLRDGRRVVAACRSNGPASELEELDRRYGDRLVRARLDVADEGSIAAFAAALDDSTIDVLINNAGVSVEEDFGEWTAATFERQSRVNAIGPALVTQALAPRLAAGARVVNVSSGMGSLASNPNPDTGLDAYAVSKAALNMVTVRLAAKLRPRGIAVVAVNPGWVRTDMGGPDATAGVAETVARIARAIEGLTLEHTGRFLSDEGAGVAW